jgi:hypothetical protein
MTNEEEPRAQAHYSHIKDAFRVALLVPGSTTPKVLGRTPPQATCNVLRELYISTFESDILSFYQEQKDRMGDSPDSISDVSLCKFLLAMGIGLLFAPASVRLASK